MNCVNHPEAAVSAYCQNCGKGLCAACVRTMQGNVYCEQCFAARIPGAPGAPSGAYPPGVGVPVGANPGTAALLGFIPGVGAMYNGQYIKAIVHVIVFVVLIGLADRYGFFGILIGFWVLYQVFDAFQTAKARRDGLPLPDPFGLNELGNAIGGHSSNRPPTPPPPGPGAAPPPYNDWADQVRRQAQEWGSQAGQLGEQIRQRVVTEAHAQSFYPGYGPGNPGFGGGPGAPGYGPPPPGVPPVYGPTPPMPPVPPQMELERARREPIGAIVLILLGMLFLFNTLGFFSFGWISHGWPLIVVGIAIWLLARGGGGRFRMRVPPPPAAPPDPNRPQPPAGGGQ
jgi:hypothetical protein